MALGLHVTDEALSGFLDVYNPTVAALRKRWPALPLPEFTFEVWLGGLIAAVVVLLLLAPFAFRGARWLRVPAALFALLMIVNAVGHTLGTIFGRTLDSSVTFSGPMPGFYSSPFLAAASFWLLSALWRGQGRAVRP
jgi:hypothetical protein